MITFSNLGKQGRLGNQLFQIASTMGIAASNGHDVCFPEWGYGRYFINRLPSGTISPENLYTYQEISSNYRPIPLSQTKNYSLSGYFQSWKYFKNIEHIIKNFFVPIWETHTRDAVSIHVRRGDYVGSNLHNNLGESYYKQAMSLFPDDRFLIFSDDVEFVRECGWFDLSRCAIKNPDDIYVIPQDLVHLIHMSNCKAHIIANSSFSWWAAYLSGNKTVAPKQWITTEKQNDRLMPDWISL